MRPTENIEDFIKNRKPHVRTRADSDKRVLEDSFSAMEQAIRSKEAADQPHIWRKIMKTKITKFAAAAAVIIAVFLGLNFLGMPIDGASVAWADVAEHITQVDYVHVYYFKSRDNVLNSDFEAWYDNGKMVIKKRGYTVYDDGQIQQGFTREGKRTTKEPSKFADGQDRKSVV